MTPITESVQGTRYEVAADHESVTVFAEDAKSLARAVASLAGPVRFEVIEVQDHVSRGYNVQWHCPFCTSTMLVGSYNNVADLAFVATDVDGAVAEHQAKRVDCGVPA